MHAREWFRLPVVICAIAIGNAGAGVARAQRGPEPKAASVVAIGADYSASVARVLAGQVAGDAVAHDATVRTGDRTLGIRAVAVLPPLIRSGTAKLHAVTLTLVLRNGAPTEGECRLDGQVSEELCRIARAFDWPAPTTTYMLKQYYVLSTDSNAPKSAAQTPRR